MNAHGYLNELLQTAVRAAGCTLWGIDRNGTGHGSVLCVYIEKEGGVTLEDCSRVSRQVSDVLDVEDCIEGSYHLEVSSPGLDRVLFCPEHFTLYIGKKVRMKLRQSIHGARRFAGVLRYADAEAVVIDLDGQDIRIDYGIIDRARLVPEF